MPACRSRPVPSFATRLAAVIAAAVVAAGCASTAPRRPHAGDPGVLQGGVAGGPAGAYEAGRLSRDVPSVAGPFVLTWLAPGDELDVVPADGKAPAIGTLAGPLGGPFHLPAGAKLAVRGSEGSALYSGYRPLAATRALEAWVGRSIQVATGAGAPEPWLLRQIGSDHLVLERSRTFRVIPLRRLAEIGWTDLSGVDPTPRVTLSPE
jgi:hypothetical protein